MDRIDLTLREAAERLQTHPETVRVWLREGMFPHAYEMPHRGGWRIPLADVQSVAEAPPDPSWRNLRVDAADT